MPGPLYSAFELQVGVPHAAITASKEDMDFVGKIIELECRLQTRVCFLLQQLTQVVSVACLHIPHLTREI